MKKILVVDDDEMNLLLYYEELSDEGYEVIITSNCDDFMQLVAQQKPDVIILDIKMGEFNGLDILQEIRNLYYNLPIILCSAYPVFKYDLRSIAADYYIVKNSDLSELKLKIKMALESGMSLPSENWIRANTYLL
jgi:DNA-binding response OmpR family regulator